MTQQGAFVKGKVITRQVIRAVKPLSSAAVRVKVNHAETNVKVELPTAFECDS
jgi:hypothetical protein